MTLRIRPAAPDDATFINDLRNHYVRTSVAIYSEVETTLEERLRWLTGRDADRHPVTVATLDGEPAGWASLSPAMQPADGYRFTAEDSVYVRPATTRPRRRLCAARRPARPRPATAVCTASSPASIQRTDRQPAPPRKARLRRGRPTA